MLRRLEGEGEAGRERGERGMIVIRALERDYLITVSLARLLSLGWVGFGFSNTCKSGRVAWRWMAW